MKIWDTNRAYLNKPNLIILHWTCHLAFKKDEVKSVAKSKSYFSYNSKYVFYRFYKGYDEFEEMPLDPKYNRMKEFSKLPISFKNLKTKKNRNTTQKGANYEKCRQYLQKLL